MTPQPQLDSRWRALLLIESLSGLRKSSRVESQGWGRGIETQLEWYEKNCHLPLLVPLRSMSPSSSWVCLTTAAMSTTDNYVKALSLKISCQGWNPFPSWTHCSDPVCQQPAFLQCPSQADKARTGREPKSSFYLVSISLSPLKVT